MGCPEAGDAAEHRRCSSSGRYSQGETALRVKLSARLNGRSRNHSCGNRRGGPLHDPVHTDLSGNPARHTASDRMRFCPSRGNGFRQAQMATPRSGPTGHAEHGGNGRMSVKSLGGAPQRSQRSQRSLREGRFFQVIQQTVQSAVASAVVGGFPTRPPD